MTLPNTQDAANNQQESTSTPKVNPPISVRDQLKSSFEKKDFEKVSLTLDREAKRIMPQSQIDFNLGIVGLQQKDYGMARFHFEKALLEGFEPNAVRQNIRSIKLEKGLMEVETIHPVNEFLPFIAQVPFIYGQFIFLLVLTVCVVFFKKISTFLIPKSALVSFMSVWCLVFAVFASSHLLLKPAVFQFNSQIHSGPSKVYDIVGQAPEAAKVYIDEVRSDWTKIIYPTRLRGWTKNENVKKLND